MNVLQTKDQIHSGLQKYIYIYQKVIVKGLEKKSSLGHHFDNMGSFVA
jgi:hypothetical protein